MNAVGLASMNLLLNAAASALGAYVIVLLGLWLIRARDGRLRIALLLLPFVKGTYEIARGIPEGAFFWARLGGASQELGAFQLGIGMRAPLVPVVHLALGAVYRGLTYSQGIGDLLTTAISRRLGPTAPAIVGVALAGAVAVRLLVSTLRLIYAVRARREVLASASLLGTRRLGRRTVRILVAEHGASVPCAGGLRRPWICIPRSIFDALADDEREAVIAHELAHIRHHDVVLLGALSAWQAFFFFVPGLGRLAISIRAQCEMAADAAATRAVAPTTLASALVRVAEHVRADAPIPSGALALIRPGGLLVRRVTALLAPVGLAPSRRIVALRIAGALLVAASVLRATTFGNP